MAVLPRVIALVAVAVLSACTTQVGGTPVAGDTLPPPEPEELTAESVFEDLTTVDPCSLTSPDVFDSFGSADFADPESLDYCAITVQTSDGEATVSVGTFSVIHETPELQGKRVKDVDGGLWVGQNDDTPTYCSQLLVFPDDVTVEVLGAVFDGDADTCPMVEAGMDHMIEVIQTGDVAHRDPRAESLIEIDPCSLVDTSDVTAIPGLTGVQRMREYPARHSCFWAAGDDVSLRINFTAGPKPTATEAGGNEDPIAGRPTAMNPYPDVGSSAFCAVETAHFPFTEVEGVDAFEVVGVFVRMPKGQVDAGCVAARAVAEQLWPDLPPA